MTASGPVAEVMIDDEQMVGDGIVAVAVAPALGGGRASGCAPISW